MIDAHCHIDLYTNPQAIVAAAARHRITIIAVTNLPSHYQIGLPHVQGKQHIKLALGLHPLLAEKHVDEIDLFMQIAPSISFIGEIGLDFSREGIATKDQQIESLRLVFAAISDRPRFVSLHSRRAEEEIIDLLGEYNIQNAVFHWFTGTTKALERGIEQGAFFSVNTAMIVSPRGKDLISRIPKERILTETDGPHIKIGDRLVVPSDVQIVQNYLAQLWGVDAADVQQQVHKNLSVILNYIRQGLVV